MLASYGHSERDQNIYAGFISIGCIILVIISYVLHILGDQDNWTLTTKGAEARNKNIQFEMIKEKINESKAQLNKETLSLSQDSEKTNSHNNNKLIATTESKKKGKKKEESTIQRREIQQNINEKILDSQENKNINKNENLNQKGKKKVESKPSNKKNSKSQKL